MSHSSSFGAAPDGHVLFQGGRDSTLKSKESTHQAPRDSSSAKQPPSSSLSAANLGTDDWDKDFHTSVWLTQGPKENEACKRCGRLTVAHWLVPPWSMLMTFYTHTMHIFFFFFCLCRSSPLSQPRNRHLQFAESVHGASRPDRGGREEDGRDGQIRSGGGRGARLSRLPSNILSQRSSLGGGEEQRERQHFLPVPGAGERLSRVQGGGAMIRHLEGKNSFFQADLPNLRLRGRNCGNYASTVVCVRVRVCARLCLYVYAEQNWVRLTNCES